MSSVASQTDGYVQAFAGSRLTTLRNSEPVEKPSLSRRMPTDRPAVESQESVFSCKIDLEGAFAAMHHWQLKYYPRPGLWVGPPALTAENCIRLT